MKVWVPRPASGPEWMSSGIASCLPAARLAGCKATACQSPLVHTVARLGADAVADLLGRIARGHRLGPDALAGRVGAHELAVADDALLQVNAGGEGDARAQHAVAPRDGSLQLRVGGDAGAGPRQEGRIQRLARLQEALRVADVDPVAFEGEAPEALGQQVREDLLLQAHQLAGGREGEGGALQDVGAGVDEAGRGGAL